MSSRIGLSLSRDKSKQMTWPLSSNDSKLGLEQYSKDRVPRKIVGNRGTGTFYPKESEVSSSLFSGKTVEVTIQRGTKRIKRQLNSIAPFPVSNKAGKHVCDTCQREIGEEISRLIIMRDTDGGPHVLCFHFFFPCWDFTLLCQKYPHLIIDKLRYSLPDKMQMKKKSVEDLQNNLNFWN